MYKSMDELRKKIGPETEIVDDDSPEESSAKTPHHQWTAEERNLARQMAAENYLLWIKPRATIFTQRREYIDMIGCRLSAPGYVTGKSGWQPKNDKLWTQTETYFFYDYVQPLVDDGQLELAVPQVAIFMPGQRVTVDFAAFDQRGVCHLYEVKGSYALGSQSRASAKYRWLRYYLDVVGSPHLIWWATMQKGGGFKVKEVLAPPKINPLLGQNQ